MDYFFFLFLLFLASFLFLRNRRRIAGSNLPPGSLGWPVIGETLELFLSKNAESFVRKRLEKHSTEVFKTNLLGENAVVFSGAEANKFVSANEQKLVRVWLPRSQSRIFAVAAIPQTTPRVSRIAALLKPDSRAVEKFDYLAKDQLRKHCKGNGGAVRAYELVKSFVLTLSCSHLLGLRPERAAEAAARWRFNDVVNGIQSIHVDFPGTVFRRAKRAAAEVRRGIEAMIEEEIVRGEAVEDSLLSVLSSAGQGGKVIPGTVANVVMGVMAASYGSVVTTIALMLKFVGERPDVYDKIYSEQLEIMTLKGSETLNWNHINRMRYTWAVACETMRIAPPFLGTFREVLTDFDYAGFTIPKGWKIFWAVNMTNKNPDYFPDPEKFDPSRFVENEHLPFTFLPFGGGPRMCSGKEYARLAILTFFHNLVTNYKWEILSPDEKISGGMDMPVPANGLPIRLHPHFSSG